jgi:hypothetical protein
MILILILDEWIIHDLQGDNGKDRQEESLELLERIKRNCDKIAIVKNSKFVNKIWQFSKEASKSSSQAKRNIFRILKNEFLFNLNKSEILELEHAKVKDLMEVLEEVNKDDHYIVIAYHSLKQKGVECVIVTTDKPLSEILIRHNINCKLRDGFLKDYLCKT